MRTSDFLLCVIGAMGGSVTGRTLLQKTCYFVGVQLGWQGEPGFKAHYYGPYSPAIDDALARMTDLGFLDKRTIGFGAADSSGFEIRRNDYDLTEEGEEILRILRNRRPEEYAQVSEAVEKIKTAGNPEYLELSIAAKAYFILHKEGGSLTKRAIRSEAADLGWSIEEQSLNRAVDFLENLGLVRAS